ncbi:MAG: glycerol-3-phosphate 1-O-acyltransferase PlsY [Gammaproteobacteria bacterium]|jgi:glycerol-3-phosphate acyltransferase PlsY
MIEFSPLFITLVVIAYLMGSLSAAIIVCKAMGLADPRTEGSNNPGATNVLRIGGKKAAAITLAGDALKGLTPVLIGHAFDQNVANLGLIGLAAFLGHLFPVFFSFRGGKGVATAFGVMVGISWMVGLAVLATWLIVAALFNISSLAALTAACLAPLYFWLVIPNVPLLVTIIVMSVILVVRHHSNIRKLLQGTEGKIRK